MDIIKVVQVDERRAQGEYEPFAFRIYFYSAAGEGSFAVDTYSVEADGVEPAIEWAKQQAAGRRFSIAAEIGNRDSPDLVWILGHDPNSPGANSPGS